MCLERNVGFSLLLQLQVATVSSAIHIYGLSPAVLAETYVAGQTSRYKVSLKSVHSFSNWYMRKGRQGTANGALWHLFNLLLFYLPVVGVEGYWCWSHSDTHTQHTHDRTPLDEWSARRRGLSTCTTHNILKRQHLCLGGIRNRNPSKRAAVDTCLLLLLLNLF